MKNAIIKSFDRPDEVREFPLGRVELINVGGTVVGRATFEPGWKWSESVKPIVHTETCQAPHFQYHMTGTLVVIQDGVRHEVKPGEISMLPPGHDAWVEGDEPVRLVDFQGMLDYAHSFEHQVEAIKEELRSSENRHRTILSAVTEGIVGLNINGEVVFANPAAAAMLGYAESELLGRKLHALVHHSHPDGSPYPECDCPSNHTFRDGIPRTVDNEVYWRKDGVALPVEYTTTPFHQGAALAGVVIVFRDISERLAATAALLKAKESAEAANRAKSIFLANMSHELRTPLNAILGFASLMGHETPKDSPSAEKLAIIHRSGEHLLALINDILDLSKIEAGRVEIAEAPCDLGAILSDTLRLLEERARVKGLALTLDQTSSFPAFIRTDGDKLRRCLINLLGNAVKFTKQGFVTLAVTVDSAPAAGGAQCLRFTITDTGRGIPADQLPKLFSPFERGHADSAVEGTGLGLSIAREYVRLMGGDIVVESKVGSGSVFRFHILAKPITEDEVRALSARSISDIVAMPGAASTPVLIVEDQAANRLYLKLLLTRLGFPVTEAENGAEAVRLVAQGPAPALILLDRRMPVMDGIAAAKALRALPGGSALRIIAVTAEAFEEDRAAMLAAGCDGFVRKPYTEAILLETIAKVLSLEPVRGEAPAKAEAPASETSVLDALLALPAPTLDKLDAAIAAADGDAAAELLGPHREAMRLLRPMLAVYRFDQIGVWLRAARQA